MLTKLDGVFRGGAFAAAAFLALATARRDRPLAADPPDAESRPEAVPADAALHVRYADARLRLAQLQLARAEEFNKRSPGLLTETDMRRLRHRVELLRAQVAATKDQPHGHALELQRAEAKAMARIAEAEFQDAVAVRRRQPQAMSENELMQFETKAEIARLRADLWSDPSFRRSAIDVTQMQIDQLTDMLIEAADAVEAAPAINRR